VAPCLRLWFWIVKICWILYAKWKYLTDQFQLCFYFCVGNTKQQCDVVDTETWLKLRDRDSRLQNLWILPKRFKKMSSPLPKSSFCGISGIFPTCFHCFCQYVSADSGTWPPRAFPESSFTIYTGEREFACFSYLCHHQRWK